MELRRGAVLAAVLFAVPAASSAGSSVRTIYRGSQGVGVVRARSVSRVTYRSAVTRRGGGTVPSEPAPPKYSVAGGGAYGSGLRRYEYAAPAAPPVYETAQPSVYAPPPSIEAEFLQRLERKHARERRELNANGAKFDSVTALGPIGDARMGSFRQNGGIVSSGGADFSGTHDQDAGSHNRDQGGKPDDPKSRPGSSPGGIGKKDK